jgi:hypothetical protein
MSSEAARCQDIKLKSEAHWCERMSITKTFVYGPRIHPLPDFCFLKNVTWPLPWVLNWKLFPLIFQDSLLLILIRVYIAKRKPFLCNLLQTIICLLNIPSSLHAEKCTWYYIMVHNWWMSLGGLKIITAAQSRNTLWCTRICSLTDQQLGPLVPRRTRTFCVSY